MTITYRNTKGSALTYGEVDENFRDLFANTDIHRVLTNGNTTNLGMTVANLTVTNTLNVVTLSVNSSISVINVSSNGTINAVSISTSNLTANIQTLNTLIVNSAAAPASVSSTGLRGEVRWDADYVYVCVANNSWKRAALTTWV